MILNLTKTVTEMMKLLTIRKGLLPLESILACAKAVGGLESEMKKVKVPYYTYITSQIFNAGKKSATFN